MVVLNRIYTRTGDDGTTALGGGERRHKYDLRIAAYGSVDELNAVIGVARLHTGADPDIDAILARIQNDLFDLGADLSTPHKAKGPGGERLAIVDAQTERLEREIDRLGESVSAAVRKYINRLSDLLFVASRYCNDKGARDVLWVPGQNR